MRVFSSSRLVFIVQSLLLVLFATLAAAATSTAGEKTYRLRGTITSNSILEDVTELATRAQVVVNGGEHVGFIQKDGSFVVDNVALGDSLLEINSAEYAFPKVHVRISLKESGQASIAARYVQIGSDWSDESPILGYPLRLAATEKYNFFTERQGFSIIAMFSNPYMMMVGASLVAVFLLPKLQANLDPEALEEMKNKK